MQKKLLNILLGSLLFPALVLSQSKPAGSTATKTSIIAQQTAALVKALIDSINTANPKSTAKKTTYGHLVVTTDKITVYNASGNKLPNPNLTTAQQADVAAGISKLDDAVQYTYVQIDSVQLKFLKNTLSWVRVYAPNVKFTQTTSTIDPLLLKPSDTITVTIKGIAGQIKVSDLLSFNWDTAPEDNIESGVFTVTVKNPTLAITSY